MPTTGSATYSGVVYGAGYYGGTQHDASLSGTSAFNVNFGTSAASLVLSLTATDKTPSAAYSLGDVTMTGALGNSCPGGCRASFGLNSFAGGTTGNASGAFFGPQAAEFGAAFDFMIPAGDGQATHTSIFAGVTVGKKN